VVSEEARMFLVDRADDLARGARALHQVIDQFLGKRLSEEFLQADSEAETTIAVTVVNSQLAFVVDR
jgi:ATP-dependent Clp protease ATP-binding subunit ClpA